MSLTYEEQETIITYDRLSKSMHVYTADTNLIKRLDALEAYKRINVQTQDGVIVSADYEADKRLCTLRSKRVTRVFTEEQKEMAVERLARARSLKSI
jgi:hypothetical protein